MRGDNMNMCGNYVNLFVYHVRFTQDSPGTNIRNN